MKFNLKLTIILIASLAISNVNAQNSVLAKWTAKLTPSQAFIENKGQFKTGANTLLKSEKVEFAVDHGSTMIYFTAKGINYTFLKTFKKDKEEIEREEKEMERHKNKLWTAEEWMEKEKEERKLNFKVDEVAMLWENSNPAVEIIASESKNDYHSYTYKNENGVEVNTNFIKGYKKIIYKNLYPNIDVEYTFHPEGGIKYAIILHPGADASVIKMNYTKGLSIKENNNLHISTKFGDIIDHAPLTFYANDHKKIVSSKFIKKGKTASFELGDYDKNQTLIIDPWQLTPAYNTNWDCVWECEKDGAGNVYTIGGVSPMVLQKYNAAGTLQWSYNTPYDTTSWLGTFATDLAGNSYVTQGSTAKILKVNTAGTLLWSNNNPGGSSSELWNIAFNCDQTSLIVAGTTTALRGAIFSININSGAVTSTKVVGYGSAFGFPPSIQEVRAITPAKNGKYYFLTLDTIGYINQNFSLCSSGTTLYKTNSTYALSYKCENFRYNNTGIMAIRANGNFVYTQNGVNVHKRSLATGAILATAAIPGGASSTSLGQNQVGNSGIDIDDCGNVYVGSSTGVIKYDANLTLLSQIATPYKVFDVNVSTGGDVIICGATGNQSTNARTGYIQSINMSACAPMTQVCCDATICSAGPFCTSAPAVTLQGATPGGVWSGPGITNPSTGTFNPGTAGVGNHTIKYTLPCGADSIVIVVTACGSLSVCATSGSLTASGGAGTYTWSSTSTTVSCASCPGGACIPFVCAGTAVPTWTASGTTVTAPAAGVFPIKLTDVLTGTTVTLTTLASIPPCTTTSCPTLTLAVTSQTNVNCFGASTGTAAVSGSGGTGPYTFTWTPGNLTGASQTGLAAGTYTINFKDANQCPGTGTLTITQPTAALNAVISATTTTGCGASTGGATVTASGGTPSYTYSWTPSGGTTAGVSNLAAGNHTVTVTDAKGCTKTAVANITTAGGPTLSVSSQTNVNCFGANTGTATVSAAGGTGPYSYTWTPGNLSGASQTTLGAGTYTINVSDAGQCTGSTTLTITQPTAALNAVISATTTTGCGTSTGGATVTASGGSPSYTYSWSPSGGTTAGVSNLGSGSNTVVVSDIKGCTVTAVANIITAGGPTLSVVSQTNVNCFGASTGTATINASGGTGPYSYTWSPGNLNGTSQTTLSAGIYTINITDASLCAGSGTLSITQPTSAVAGVISNTIAGSCGSNNGSATVTASGGTPSYTYSWSPNGGSTPAVSNLSSGVNSVTITDAKGCISTVTLSINSIGGPTLSVSSQTNVNCFGASTGTATVNASGGTGPYSYTWTPGSLVGASQTSLSAGIYTITIKDNNLCTGSGTIAITQPTSAVSAAIAGNPSGCGGSTGSATVTASGGTPSYTYSWSTGSSAASISGLAAGNYTVTVTDSKGCTTTSVTTISSSGGGAALSVTSQSNVACYGTATGSATVNASGSGGPFTYTWSPSGGNSANATGLGAGTYTVFVKDGSCISTITLSISEPPPITLTVSSTPENCGDFDGSATVAASGGNGVLTPLWSNGVTSTLNDAIPGGIYTVSVTDANGCAATATTVVYVTGGLPVDAGLGTTIHAGETAVLNGAVPPGATVVWTPSVSLSCPTCPSTDASPVVTTNYTITATLNGCTGYDTVTVFIDIICGELFIPTAFSPNNDGENDVLYVMSNCITNLEFAIFDRWGEKVFETKDPTQGWDGTFNGKTMNPAAFAYYLKATVNGEEVSKKGSISLIK